MFLYLVSKVLTHESQYQLSTSIFKLGSFSNGIASNLEMSTLLSSSVCQILLVLAIFGPSGATLNDCTTGKGLSISVAKILKEYYLCSCTLKL